jgi:general stress protein 26
VLERKNELKTKILEILDEHRTITVATLRSDGWPQATIVGYVHDDLILYFVAAASSQKHANILHDSRVSIALGHEEPGRLRGLSMAGHAQFVSDHKEVESVNRLIRKQYHGEVVFAPRETSAVLIRVTPMVISVIDLGKGPGKPELLSVSDAHNVQEIEVSSGALESPQYVAVRAVIPHEGGYRKDAPL